MTKREYLKNQTHEQLEIFVMNGDMQEEILRDRLFLLGGCHNFGGQDGTDGACVDCCYENRALFDRCCLFQNVCHSYLVNKKMLKEASEEIKDYAMEEF